MAPPRDPRRPWALRLVGLALLPVAALVTSGWLYIDDLRAQVYASGRPLWPFVVEFNNTHLAPSARTVDWLQARYAALEHWPAVVYTVVLHLALGLAIWWLLRGSWARARWPCPSWPWPSSLRAPSPRQRGSGRR